MVYKEERCHLTNFIMTSAAEAQQGIYTCALTHTHDNLESLGQQYKEDLLYYNNTKAIIAFVLSAFVSWAEDN